MKASLLSSVELLNGGDPVPVGGPRARTLLAHLLLRPEQLVSTDGLIDAIWGEEPPRTARNALQTYPSPFGRHWTRTAGKGGPRRRSSRDPGSRLQ